MLFDGCALSLAIITSPNSESNEEELSGQGYLHTGSLVHWTLTTEIANNQPVYRVFFSIFYFVRTLNFTRRHSMTDFMH